MRLKFDGWSGWNAKESASMDILLPYAERNDLASGCAISDVSPSGKMRVR